MSKMSRRKGGTGEREVAAILKAHGYDGKRTFQQLAGDRCDVTGLPGFAIEVKRTERLDLWGALKQAEEAAADYEVPLLAFRRNRSPWMACLPLEDLLNLIDKQALEDAA